MNKELHKNFRWEEAAKALRKLFNQICEAKISRKRSFDYDGPEILSSSILATSTSLKEAFEKDWLDYCKERGQDKIDVFINKVFQLGYSVGYERSEATNLNFQIINDLLGTNQTLREEISSLKAQLNGEEFIAEKNDEKDTITGPFSIDELSEQAKEYAVEYYLQNFYDVNDVIDPFKDHYKNALSKKGFDDVTDIICNMNDFHVTFNSKVNINYYLDNVIAPKKKKAFEMIVISYKVDYYTHNEEACENERNKITSTIGNDIPIDLRKGYQLQILQLDLGEYYKQISESLGDELESLIKQTKKPEAVIEIMRDLNFLFDENGCVINV